MHEPCIIPRSEHILSRLTEESARILSRSFFFFISVHDIVRGDGGDRVGGGDIGDGRREGGGDIGDGGREGGGGGAV